jgi:hypothetical protein
MAEDYANVDAAEFFAAEKRRRADKFADACWDMYTAGKFDGKGFEEIGNLCKDVLGSFWSLKLVPAEKPAKRSKAKDTTAPPPAPPPQQPPKAGQHAPPPTGGQ